MSPVPGTEDLVIVSYGREGRDETFAGDICISDACTLVFAGMTWTQVLEFASEALQQAPGHHLVLKRKEAPYPMTLPDGIEDLLRTDLPKAIAALTIGPQRIVIAAPRRTATVGLRHGHDTLADALGDDVYLKVRTVLGQRKQVESPITGRWDYVEPGLEMGLGTYIKVPLLPAGTTGHLPLGPTLGGRWTTVATEYLLQLGLPRYYLPRCWNATGGWISHDTLTELYALYIKEKSYVTNS